MTGRRSHGRLSALNGVVHQGTDERAACIRLQLNDVEIAQQPVIEARASCRGSLEPCAMVVREWPVTRAVAEMLTPSTRRLATWSNSRPLQRRPRYAVPVFVLSVPPHTVQRYRRRRPDCVTNQPWPTMLRPGFPKLSHPGLPHALSSIAFIAPV